MKPRIRLSQWLNDCRWMCTDQGRTVGWGATPFYAYCEWLGNKRLEEARWAARKEALIAKGGVLRREVDGTESVLSAQ